MPRAGILVLAFLASAAARGSAAEPQGGYTTEEHAELGLTFPRPRDYDPIPVQPNERWVVLQYAEKLDERRGPKAFRPGLRLVWIDRLPDPPPITAEPLPGPESPARDPEGRSQSAPPVEPPSAVPPPINTLERYFEQVLPDWELGAPLPQRERDGFATEERLAHPRKNTSRIVAWIWSWKDARRTVALIGQCAQDDFKEQGKIWRTMASKLRLSEPQSRDTTEWERFYARRPELKDPAFRLRMRAGLVRGWDARDTENYIILHGTTNEALVRRLAQELEAIRTAYVELFPPTRPVESVSAVRICADRDEYVQYGGSPWSGGYWNADAEELVFYEYGDTKDDRSRGENDSRIVLYHEAFHQYIYYSAGELAPHSWFNEGHGDFFSGARFDAAGRIAKIGINPWRASFIQEVLREGRYLPWEKILGYEQVQFYGPERAICYAQGWSMVYFLRTAKEVARSPAWAAILPTYFQTLKASYDGELEELGRSGQLDVQEQLAGAQQRARERALEAAFQGLDLAELQAAWLEFTLELEPPR